MKLTKILVVLVLVISLCTSVHAESSDYVYPRLSDMSDEECVAFSELHGVEIPEIYLNDPALGTFIRSVILEVEKNPYIYFVVGDSRIADFSNAIKDVVNAYYGISERGVSRNSGYELQFSTPVGEWKSYYDDYNCYAYALGRISRSYYPGQISHCSYSPYQTVAQWADNTVADLVAIGYDCVITSENYTEIMALSSTHTIICLRKCSTSGKEDYHYMRYDPQYDEWRHKPGATQVLAFDYLPYQRNWTNEYTYVKDGVTYTGPGDRSYTGDIHYFAFADHPYTQSYGGEHYHSGNQHYYKVLNTCVACGDTYYTWDVLPCSGPPCIDYSPYAHDDFELVEE